MHRIIEQTAASRGMVKTPNLSSVPWPDKGHSDPMKIGCSHSYFHISHEETAVHAEYHPHLAAAQGPHPRDEARDETQPQAQDAHSPARLGRLLSHPDLPGSLLFQDHRLRPPRALRRGGRAEGRLRGSWSARAQTVDREADRRVRRAFGRRGGAHLPRMAALALELQAFGRGTVQGAGHPGKPGDGSPRAPWPGLPLEEAASGRAREGLRRAQRAKAGEAFGCPFDGREGGSLLPGGDQTPDQPEGRLLLDAEGQAETAEETLIELPCELAKQLQVAARLGDRRQCGLQVPSLLRTLQDVEGMGL